MSSHEDETRVSWERVVLTTTTTNNNNSETISVCIHDSNAQGEEVSWQYQVFRGDLIWSPSAALASLNYSNQVDPPPGLGEDGILQRNVISLDESMEEEEDEDEEDDDLCAASEASIDGLEKFRVEKGLGLENPCSICLDELEIRSEATKMPCSHVFHTNCIVKWLERSNMCPLCRCQMPKRQLGCRRIFPNL